MALISRQSEMLSVPPRPLVACRLVDRVPMTCFLTKMAAEKTIRSSLPGLWLCEATLPPARVGGARVTTASRDAPAALLTAGAAERRPPRKWRAPRPWRAAVPRRGTF
jgi:hypothetical protein